MEDDFYATIKFKSGEEIFAKVNCNEDGDRIFLLLNNPIMMEKVKNRTGIYGYKVEPWIKTSREEIFLVNIDDVLTMSESKDMEIILMHEAFRKANEYDDRTEIKLDRKMGYLSSISDAKKALEKLYRNK